MEEIFSLKLHGLASKPIWTVPRPRRRFLLACSMSIKNDRKSTMSDSTKQMNDFCGIDADVTFKISGEDSVGLIRIQYLVWPELRNDRSFLEMVIELTTAVPQQYSWPSGQPFPSSSACAC